MRNLLVILLVITSVSLFGQKQKPGGKGNGLYGTGANELDKGWFFGIGGTYMLGYPKTTYQQSYFDTAGVPGTVDYEASAKGKFGLYAEVGLFRMNGRRVINYMDYGIAYKWFRGGEDYSVTNTYNGTPLTPFTQEGSFGDHLISGNFRIGHRYDASETKFVVNGLGLNLDYHIIAGRTGTPQVPTNDKYEVVNSLLGEMHYFFGMGFKTGGRLMIMPVIETPILALWPFNHIVSTHPYWNVRFRPIMFRVRFMFLSKGSKSCPKVYNPMGIDPYNQLDN